MTTAVYDIGDLVRCSALFKNDAGVATDPTTVTLQIKKPSGTVETKTWAAAEVTRDGAGAFHFDIAIDASGSWYYRWKGTGTVTAAQEARIAIRQSVFAS